MNHNIVLLIVLATFRILDYHGCNGQVSTPITSLPSLSLPPPCPPPPAGPPPPPLKPPPRAPLTRSSDPYNCCFDPYHCCDHDNNSHSGIDILLVVLVGAILVVLILFSIFFVYNFWGFRQFVVAIGAGLTNIVHAINENLVKSINGVAGAINTNLGANGPINRSLTSIDGKLGAIDGKLGAIDGRLAAIPGPLLEISSRLENICPNCNVYLTVLPCKCGGSTCECDGSPSSPCRCDDFPYSPCRH